MSLQYIFVASTPGQVTQPVRYNGANAISNSSTITGGLWTAAAGGTASELQVAGLNIGSSNRTGLLNSPPSIIAYDGKALFSEGGLWITDGTPLGTHEISTLPILDVVGLYQGRSPPDFTPLQGKILYAALAAPDGLVLTDGSAAGTQPIPVAATSGRGSVPQDLTSLGNKVAFDNFDLAGTSGTLWVTDGTAAGTVIIPAANGTEVISPADLTPFGGFALFSAGPDSNAGLWRTDGTQAGTFQITIAGAAAANVVGGGLTPYDITSLGSKAVFLGVDAAGSFSLWVTDGTSAGTAEYAALRLSAASGQLMIAGVGSRAVLNGVAADGSTGLFSTDGTAAGTLQIGSFVPTSIVASGSRALVSGLANGQAELFVTDGTQAGTTVLIPAGSPAAGLAASNIQASGTGFLFDAPDSNGVLRIWSSDGTTAGTVPIVVAPVSQIGPVDIVPVDTPPLYLAALDASSGTALAAGNTVVFTLKTISR